MEKVYIYGILFSERICAEIFVSYEQWLQGGVGCGAVTVIAMWRCLSLVARRLFAMAANEYTSTHTQGDLKRKRGLHCLLCTNKGNKKIHNGGSAILLPLAATFHYIYIYIGIHYYCVLFLAMRGKVSCTFFLFSSRDARCFLSFECGHGCLNSECCSSICEITCNKQPATEMNSNQNIFMPHKFWLLQMLSRNAHAAFFACASSSTLIQQREFTFLVHGCILEGEIFVQPNFNQCDGGMHKLTATSKMC